PPPTAVAKLASPRTGDGPGEPWRVLQVCGGPEIAVLAGVVLGAAEAGAVVVTDGLATAVAVLIAVRLQPAAGAHLVAGQRSREAGHPLVLQALGLEPILDLRLRAGEGAGAALAWGVLRAGLDLRSSTAVTGLAPQPGSDSWPGLTPRPR
ncbi:MAG: nicotinate-nucleotide--dimethylbenzimidazole phosphoribosyltransferase, partial [Acidimicrobiales bacterium]